MERPPIRWDRGILLLGSDNSPLWHAFNLLFFEGYSSYLENFNIKAAMFMRANEFAM